MSGGVDSSVAAALLVEQGFEVIGITMRLWTESRPEDYTGRSQCCAIEDIGDARRVAQRLGIPHYTLNLERPFRRLVVDRFIEQYAHGRTPNPCLDCNTHIKFDAFLERAKALGADWIATGHYARRELGSDGQAQLLRGLDRDKDQSYFLYTLTPEALAMTQFPVGTLQKLEVRTVAERHNLAVADKAESADICFVPGGDYRSVVASAVADRPGLILDTEGREIGEHRGVQHFTVGQRKGLNIGGGERQFVTAIDATTNVVVVGGADDLLVDQVALSGVKWLTEPTDRFDVQLRYRSAPAPATLHGHRLTLDEPARAVAAGQAAVFYDGDRVLGGGTVESATSVRLSSCL